MPLFIRLHGDTQPRLRGNKIITSLGFIVATGIEFAISTADFRSVRLICAWFIIRQCHFIWNNVLARSRARAISRCDGSGERKHRAAVAAVLRNIIALASVFSPRDTVIFFARALRNNCRLNVSGCD